MKRRCGSFTNVPAPHSHDVRSHASWELTVPNGKPGDAPWSDFFVHKRNIFPNDIARMLRAIYAVSPKLINHLADDDMWEWEAGRKLDEGRSTLRRIIVENNIPFTDE